MSGSHNFSYTKLFQYFIVISNYNIVEYWGEEYFIIFFK